MASSDISRMHMPQATWTDWTIRKAVKEGYKVSGWVYRAVTMIAKNGASVPWVVVDKEGVIVPNHPLSITLNRPNKHFSRQDFFELLLSWQQLAGRGFAKKVLVKNLTAELWPISPDRIAPVASKDAGKLIDGYEIIDSKGARKKSSEYTEDNVLHFKLLDPADPLEGISPLQAVARAVDIDVEQQKWNKSAMQNRGVLDGIFSFDRDIDPTLFDTYRAKLKEMFGGEANARGPGVIGSNAKYQQLSLSPAEMDFLNSRKFNRDEIFIIFGVPPQLAGVQDSSTYNNYAVSMRIFWESTVIPALFDLANTFNMSFYEELKKGEYRVQPDLTNVMALKENEDEKAKTGKVYFDMGVPVSTINDKFSLGIKEYKGWDKPWGGAKPTINSGKESSEVTEEDRKKFKLATNEQRNIQNEIDKKEDIASTVSKTSLSTALGIQQDAVFEALDEGRDIQSAITETQEMLSDTLTAIYENAANIFAGSVIIDSRGHSLNFEKRGFDPNIETAITEFLSMENIILTELGLINATTVSNILDYIIDGESEGKSIADIKQAIMDSGTFSPERALRIARTTVGNAQSIGQMVGAIEAGATKKVWVDSGFEVREEHVARNGEKVGVNERFSSQFPGHLAPRWPVDQQSAAADRINCRCSMTFE